jgi:hypothetical protein
MPDIPVFIWCVVQALQFLLFRLVVSNCSHIFSCNIVLPSAVPYLCNGISNLWCRKVTNTAIVIFVTAVVIIMDFRPQYTDALDINNKSDDFLVVTLTCVPGHVSIVFWLAIMCYSCVHLRSRLLIL